MDSIILLSWLAYLICALLLLFSSWKLMKWLPFSLKCSLFLSQVAVLFIPAPVMDTNLAPAFIVIILAVLSGTAVADWIEPALPLLLALVAAWPVGFFCGWLAKRRTEQQQHEEEDVNP